MTFSDEQLRRIVTIIHSTNGRTRHVDGRDFDDERHALASEVLRLRDEVKRLRAAERKRSGGTPEWLSEALNSGNGTYKP